MREWVERQSATQPTLTRCCASASPWKGEASLCCSVGNRRQFSVHFLNGANPSGRQCRGDPVGRPAGRWVATRDDAVPSCTIAPGRRTASPLHAPQDRPSPGAARRPLPDRERRLFVASWGTAGSVLSAHSTDQTLPAGNVGATRWVAPGGAAHAGPRRRVMWDHRARWRQGDAPRRPYMPCVEPRVL